MRVAILGGGGPAGVNSARALGKAGHEVVVTDANPEHLRFPAEYAETVHLGAPLEVEAVNGLRADVVLAQPDPLVAWLSANRAAIKGKTILPSARTVTDCQDKLWASALWGLHELRSNLPVVLREPWPDWLHIAKDRLGLPFWLRATRGAGAKGATLVRELDTAYHWIRYWASRDVHPDWMAEEYLPGRDFAWASIWHRGELVTSFARERLEYIYPHLTPDGLTGTPTIAAVVHDPRVNEAAEAAVRCITDEPHGLMCVDLREDVHGLPRPTEINAGRGFTTLGLWSLYGPNFMDTLVRLAADGRRWWLTRPDLSEAEQYDALPEGLRLERHIDCGHVFVPAPVRERRLALSQCA